MVKVSVVVPVWNPGRYLDRCVESLLGQTMAPDDLELLFVDDGSTDGTGQRLDELAAEHGQVRVIHIPNSGWPGKPRNVGIAHAQGEFVQFLDNDDTLAPEALQRLYHLGHTSDADIVIGKVTSDFRGVPHNLFRSTRTHRTLADTPLIESLTPHKMFAKAFLDRYPELRFPEGRRRLEDQLFMVRAYLAAKNVSILGDYPCYFYRKRDDGTNAGSTRIDPRGYYANLREVLDAIVAGTDPGPVRSRLLERFYRNECLSRLGGAVLGYDDVFRRELLTEVRAIISEYFDSTVDPLLPGAIRVRAVAARAGRLDDLMAIAARYNGIGAHARLEQLCWRQGALTVQARVRLAYADGTPVLFKQRDGRLYLDPSVCGPGVPVELRDVTDELSRHQVDLVIRDRETSAEFFLPGSVECVPRAHGRDRGGDLVSLSFAMTATLDPRTALGGRAMHRGVWDAFVRLQVFGWTRNTRLGADRAAVATEGARPALVGPPRLLVIPYWTSPHDNLSIGVNQAAKTLSSAVRGVSARGEVRRDGDHDVVTVHTPLILAPGMTDVPGRLHLADPRSGQAIHIPATLHSGLPHTALAVVTATVPRTRWRARPDGHAVTAGRWRLSFVADVDAGDFSLPLAAALRVRPGRRPAVVAPLPPGRRALLVRAGRLLPPRVRRFAARLLDRVGR
jgi:glycosyltransferase involved in cell wall biosynthesis